jgi:septal ring factor EnvC (AmiA/AmiB activator)
MSGPTKKQLHEKINRLENENDGLTAERSLMERKCADLSRELERVRSQNRSLSEAEREAQKRYAALLEKAQRALVLNTEILSEPLPSNAPSQDMAAVLWGGE